MQSVNACLRCLDVYAIIKKTRKINNRSLAVQVEALVIIKK